MMRKWTHFASVWTSVFVIFCTAVVVESALGWEFSLEGYMSWTYQFYHQQGSRGFFGKYDIDNDMTSFSDNINFWAGGTLDTNIVSGASAAWSFYKVEFYPTLKINEAVKLRGKYRIGLWNNIYNANYITYDSPGVNVTISDGQWTMFWATAVTPWGAFALGKRPWRFGTGLQYDGEDSATTESTLVVAPVGPFDIGLGFYPYRYAGTGTDLPASTEIHLYDIDRNPPLIPLPLPKEHSYTPGGYYGHADTSGILDKDLLAFVTFTGGPLNAGILGMYGKYHIGPEATLKDTKINYQAALDAEYTHGATYLKYFDGRFFLNAEVAWVNWRDRQSYSGPNSSNIPIGPEEIPGSWRFPATRYTEQWRYVVEGGVVAGPAKIALMHAWTPGSDRRAGIFIDRQQGMFVWHPTYDRLIGNYFLFRPYSYLFAYTYGGGLNAYNFSIDGYPRDASILASRIDYAVASNLNISASFFWAERTSHGYGWGCIYPQDRDPLTDELEPSGQIEINLNGYASRLKRPAPNIPDRSLGYEIMTGLDWQLLEGWKLSVTAACWFPGKWFNYACIDRSVTDWRNGDSANSWGTKPDRVLDPVIGGEFTVNFEF
jgi:hypothetical protein